MPLVSKKVRAIITSMKTSNGEASLTSHQEEGVWGQSRLYSLLRKQQKCTDPAKEEKAEQAAGKI